MNLYYAGTKGDFVNASLTTSIGRLRMRKSEETARSRLELLSCPLNNRYFAGDQLAVLRRGPRLTGDRAPWSESYNNFLAVKFVSILPGALFN
jgi:hypothetical protein